MKFEDKVKKLLFIIQTVRLFKGETVFDEQVYQISDICRELLKEDCGMDLKIHKRENDTEVIIAQMNKEFGSALI